MAIPIPGMPALVGQHAYFQWYVVDPGPSFSPGALTKALELVVL